MADKTRSTNILCRMTITPSPRLSYEAPAVRELSRDETITILSRLASEGDTEAGEVLQQLLAYDC
ncbi:MAG: hypothetical protein QOD84_684 [Acidobacteriaceae bacterium]|jgi:hypothetical protein